MTTNLLSISFIRLAVPGKKLILTRQATGQNFTKMLAFYVDKQHSPGVPNPSRKTEAELPNLVTTITCHSVRTSCIFTCHCVCPFLITSGWVTITNAVPGGDQSALCLDAFRYKIVVGSSSLPWTMRNRSNSSRKKMSFSLPSFPGNFTEVLRVGAVFVWTVIFIFGHTLGTAFAIYLFLTPLSSFLVIYLVWSYYFHMGTSSKGGRRSLMFRELKSWEYFRDYFPARLVRTRRLDVKKNYIFGYHPHGIMCAGAWLHFGTEGTGFSRLFPGIKPHLLTMKRK